MRKKSFFFFLTGLIILTFSNGLLAEKYHTIVKVQKNYAIIKLQKNMRLKKNDIGYIYQRTAGQQQLVAETQVLKFTSQHVVTQVMKIKPGTTVKIGDLLEFGRPNLRAGSLSNAVLGKSNGPKTNFMFGLVGGVIFNTTTSYTPAEKLVWLNFDPEIKTGFSGGLTVEYRATPHLGICLELISTQGSSVWKMTDTAHDEAIITRNISCFEIPITVKSIYGPFFVQGGLNYISILKVENSESYPANNIEYEDQNQTNSYKNGVFAFDIGAGWEQLVSPGLYFSLAGRFTYSPTSIMEDNDTFFKSLKILGPKLLLGLKYRF